MLKVMDATLKTAVAKAHETADLAAKRRKHLRRRTVPGEPKREETLASMIERLRLAMAPIRSAIGYIPYDKYTEGDEAKIRAASRRLKYERKQIRKMQRG